MSARQPLRNAPSVQMHLVGMILFAALRRCRTSQRAPAESWICLFRRVCVSCSQGERKEMRWRLPEPAERARCVAWCGVTCAWGYYYQT